MSNHGMQLNNCVDDCFPKGSLKFPEELFKSAELVFLYRLFKIKDYLCTSLKNSFNRRTFRPAAQTFLRVIQKSTGGNLQQTRVNSAILMGNTSPS